MWSTPSRHEEEKKEETNTITDVARNVRYVHMQISTPKTGNKTRASKVKEALMIIFATSKHIKLHPKEAGAGEIITNIDDMVTTEEFTDQYFFDKKMGGKKFIRGEGSVDYYTTKVRLETDIGLTQMKWHTSTRFLEALKTQNIFLKEYQDGVIMRTGNVGWLAGINPTNTSIAKTTKDLNRVLEKIQATAIVDIHTVSIRFPQTKKAFVTRAYKVMSNIEKIDEARELINKTLRENDMGVGWGEVKIVKFNMDKQNTAMMIEEHNRLLHNMAVISVKNIWSINESYKDITEKEKAALGMDRKDDAGTLEDMWWALSNKYNQDIQGMVTRRGTLEILTTRKNLDDTVGFARELVSNTIGVLGEEKFARITANHNINARKPTVQEVPMVLSGKGRVRLNTTHFTEEEFKEFAKKHGIPTGDNKDDDVKEIAADLSRPPKAFYHKPGREPVEHDPRKMREGARQVWEQFTEVTKKKVRQKLAETQDILRSEMGTEQKEETKKESTSDKIARHGKMTRLEIIMKTMRESQEALEKSTSKCQEKIYSMQKTADDNMEKMSEMINKMGQSITTQNRQLEAQARAQVKQAEDIERIMKAIQAISKAVQVTTTTPQCDEDEMEIDIAESNGNKRKQNSIELTTLITDNTQESTMNLSNTAKSQSNDRHSTGGQ